jgi:TolB protein
MMPQWSHDGTRILFSSFRPGNWEIFVMNADGSGLVNLTNNSALDDWPNWQP